MRLPPMTPLMVADLEGFAGRGHRPPRRDRTRVGLAKRGLVELGRLDDILTTPGWAALDAVKITRERMRR